MTKTLPLRDIAEISAGYPFRTGISDDPDGTVRVIQMRDVSPTASVSWASTVRVRPEPNMQNYFLKQDDIVFVMRGGNYYGTLLAALPGPALAALHFFRIRIKRSDMILPAFLAWQLGQSQVQRHCSSMEAGTAQKSLRLADFSALPITALPLDRQNKLLHAVNAIHKNMEAMESGITNCRQILSAIAECELGTHRQENA